MLPLNDNNDDNNKYTENNIVLTNAPLEVMWNTHFMAPPTTSNQTKSTEKKANPQRTEVNRDGTQGQGRDSSQKGKSQHCDA